MRPLFAIAGSIIFVGLIGCGPPPPPENPTIELDRTSVGFGAEFCSGTKIGTSVPNSLSVKNAGQNNLEISEITLTGPAGDIFTMQTDTVPITVRGLKTTFITVYFAPKAKQFYDGKITIKSNDTTTPVSEVKITGRGCDGDDCPPFDPPVPQCSSNP